MHHPISVWDVYTQQTQNICRPYNIYTMLGQRRHIQSAFLQQQN